MPASVDTATQPMCRRATLTPRKSIFLGGDHRKLNYVYPLLNYPNHQVVLLLGNFRGRKFARVKIWLRGAGLILFSDEQVWNVCVTTGIGALFKSLLTTVGGLCNLLFTHITIFVAQNLRPSRSRADHRPSPTALIFYNTCMVLS